MSLELKDTLEVETPLSTSQIQLLLGDITKLPLEEKVDFVFTSAFVGNYTPVHGTLIGSLRHNLDINVGNLAKRKEMDLRQQFSCWLSAPLGDHLPYRRLVCFEQIASDDVDIQLSRLFRAMMPIFNNQDTSVITPVLATGNQRKPIQQVLKAMVTAAVEWIKAGLPLRCLKVVLYAADLSKMNKQNTECLQVFAKLKNKILKGEEKAMIKTQSYDVCLSFSEDNKDLALMVVQALLDQNSQLSVHSERFKFKPDVLWQEHIYHVMTNSKRIITLVTPSFVKYAECLEQFSMALCCNRIKKQESVMPFYLETCDALPSYMSLVQYIECRRKDPSDDISPLIRNAAQGVIESLSLSSSSPSKLPSSSSSLSPSSSSSKRQTDQSKPSSTTTNKSLSKESSSPKQNSTTTTTSNHVADEVFPSLVNNATSASNRVAGEVVQSNDKKYDIFISYSHQHGEDPKRLVEYLQSLNSNLEIFFDADGLKAGNLWQQTLYNAIENSHCMVAFLTQGYLSSPVCNEEFNLATARQFAKDSFLHLPIHTGVIDKLPKWFSHVPCVDLREEKDGLETLARQLNDMIGQFKVTPKNRNVLFIKSKMEQQRALQFREKFCLEGGNIVRNTTTDCNSEGSVMFLFAQDCMKFAAIMSAIIKKLAPDLITHLQPFKQLDRTKHLESSDIVIVFVSDQLVCSQSLLEELHTVLGKQRVNKDSTVIYLIESEHWKADPLYLHTLPYSICMDDSLWKRLERSGGNRNPRPHVVDAAGMQGMYRCKACQNLALTAASHDVLHVLSQRGHGSTIPYNLVNMAQIENENKGVNNPLVPANENIISLSSVGLMISRMLQQHQTDQKAVEATKTNNDNMGKEKNNKGQSNASATAAASETQHGRIVVNAKDVVDGEAGCDGDDGGGGSGMGSNSASQNVVVLDDWNVLNGSVDDADADDVVDDMYDDRFNEVHSISRNNVVVGEATKGGGSQKASKTCALL